MSDRRADALRALAGMDAPTFLRGLLENSAVPMGVVDPHDNSFLMVNDALCSWLGYSADELGSMRWSDVNHPDEIPMTKSWIDRTEAQQVSGYRIVKRYLRKDGSEVWGDLSISALRRADGSMWAFVGQVVDVTDKVHAEEILRQSEERFRLLAEHSGDVVWLSGADRVVSYVSPAITGTLGWQPQDLVGTGPSDLIHPEDQSTIPREQLTADGTATFRARFRSRDGAYVWCEVHSAVIREHGEVTGFVSTMRDVSEQVTAEQARAASEQRYRLIAENANDVVFRGSPDAVIEWVSPSVEHELGLAPEDVIGKQVASLLHPADVAGMRRASATLNDGENAGYRARLRTSDGSWRWVEVRAKPVFDDHGTVTARVGSMRVVDKQVEAEQALQRAKDEALSASLAKTAFLSRMSHELRTPLNAVLGFSQLLSFDTLTADQADAVEQIQLGGRHLLDLINEILDISRIEAGRISLSFESLAVDDVVAEAVELVRGLAEKDLITVTAAHDAGVYVWADRQRCIQVLVNLLSNAVKYNRPFGRVEVMCSQQDGNVRVSVADTGMGIAEGDLPRVFEPFERLGAQNSGIEGSGIGLALSQGLARAMHGRIEVESVSGEGSTFTLVLPEAAPQLDTTPTPVTVSITGTRPVRVLYVEDNPANARLMQRICELRDNTLLTVATTGEEGLVLAQGNPPDLAIVDLHLPGLSGPEVVSSLRADPRTSGVPILVVSADASHAARDVSRELGADGFLSKPLDITVVLNWINHPKAT